MAVVLALMPNCLPNTQRMIVAAKVIATTTVRQLWLTFPSILSSIVFCLNGNILSKINHANSNITITNGTITAIHCPKLMPISKPAGSFNTLKAKALGGVPIGVPIPPKLAPIGIAIVRAIRPFPSGGNALNTGVKNVSIIAAVAVFEINIENTPVMRIKPNNTISLLLPKGLIKVLAISTSNPLFVAAMARMKPPRNRMIVGSAKHAMIPTESSNCPYSLPLPCKNLNDELETQNSNTKIMVTDVAHAGIASVSHNSTAITNMAMTRC